MRRGVRRGRGSIWQRRREAQRPVGAPHSAAAVSGSELMCRREEGRKKTFANIVLLRALPENSGLVSDKVVFQAMD